MTVYVETSAVAKLLVDEPESGVLSRHLDDLAEEGRTLVSSFLLETELRRFAARAGVGQSAVSDVLDRLDLVEPDRAVFVEAGLLPGRHLRSLDALHVAMAVRVAADLMVSYDARQADGARAAGIRVVAPA